MLLENIIVFVLAAFVGREVIRYLLQNSSFENAEGRIDIVVEPTQGVGVKTSGVTIARITVR